MDNLQVTEFEIYVQICIVHYFVGSTNYFGKIGKKLSYW